ncbi:MAG: hypothetical protein R2860_17395 [Desulfobacterales bacterium]
MIDTTKALNWITHVDGELSVKSRRNHLRKRDKPDCLLRNACM